MIRTKNVSHSHRWYLVVIQASDGISVLHVAHSYCIRWQLLNFEVIANETNYCRLQECKDREASLVQQVSLG